MMNFQPKNENLDEPVTRGEFQEAMQMIANAFQRQEDRYDGRFDEMRQEFNGRFDEIITEFRVLAENIHQDVAGANKDEISAIQSAQEDHGERIERLEEKIVA